MLLSVPVEEPPRALGEGGELGEERGVAVGRRGCRTQNVAHHMMMMMMMIIIYNIMLLSVPGRGAGGCGRPTGIIIM